MRGWTMIAITVLGLALAGAACEFKLDNVPHCWPRAVEACTCETGGAGQRVCGDDSLDYGGCVCTDAGVASGADAGIDAMPDAATDAPPDAGTAAP